MTAKEFYKENKDEFNLPDGLYEHEIQTMMQWYVDHVLDECQAVNRSQTILEHCNKCIHFERYVGSNQPDDPACVSCKKGLFEFMCPEDEWGEEDCKLKEIAESLSEELDIPALSSNALVKVEQYNQLKKEIQEEILRLESIIDSLSYLFNVGTVEERIELQSKISKLEFAVFAMKHCR